MEYIGHLKGERTQLLIEHLKGTAELCESFAAKFGKEQWGYCCGLLHDIGKYSSEFQKRIRGESNAAVDHSAAGAQICMKRDGLYSFISYCIAGHHSGLPDYGNYRDTGSVSSLAGRMKKKICDYSAYKKEVRIPNLDTMPVGADENGCNDFALSTFIRMLYSCLVDADFLDTEAFMKNGETGRDSGESIEILLDKLKKYTEKWLYNTDINTVNGRRTEILKNCYEMGKREKGLFRLTVPTGGGKTIASLVFALQHAMKHHMDRVIYVIPYTSIIEQNAKIFRTILGTENVLENHCNVDYEASEELKPMQLAAENWDKPVIVTTNVQFFESLFANKSSKCRKIHNITNSVIIFDEAQMLPTNYLKPCVAMIEELVRHYGVSAVLCTATQPALQSFFGQDVKAEELCPRMEEQFKFFKRTTLKNIGKIEEDELVEKLSGEHLALCIVNTRKRAQILYSRLQGEGVYHLSTCMYPIHRKRILDEVRERLENNKRCILISTSLVEAGVDLDFRSVYRQLTGVDSIVQAAGRCNREGRNAAEESFVSIFQFEERDYVPGQQNQLDAAEELIKKDADFFALESINEYFQNLYYLKGNSLDEKKILEQFENRNYNFAKVGKEFQLIENNTMTVFVHGDSDADKIMQQIKERGFTKAGMRKAGQYCVNVYEEQLKSLYDAGKARLVSEDMPDFYELTDQEQYNEEFGLSLEVEKGAACFI